MRRNIGCNIVDHVVSRRNFVLGTAAGMAGAGMVCPAAAMLKSKQKRVLQIFLQGGVSQLESWDPKPGTEFGGPFRAIPTSVPGIHISELLPYTAMQMHRLSLVRSININTNNHAQGHVFMEKGRRNGDFPYLGSVASKYLAPKDSPLPGFIHISTRGLTDQTAAFLGARHAQMKLEGVKPPANLAPPKELTATADRRRNELRLKLNKRFAAGRQKSAIQSYDASFQQAAQLIARKALFNGEGEAKEIERYGSHAFGRNCLLARTLLEDGATCVKVTHHGYDSHAENFNFHLEQLGEFDRTFANLLTDLADRGMLESTLVLVMSEFGRTPKVNIRYGRDHWGTSWSIALGGCGIQPGAVIGKTNEKGTAVTDREVDARHLFHTYVEALGLDSTADHDIPGRSIPIGDPTGDPIKELLS